MKRGREGADGHSIESRGEGERFRSGHYRFLSGSFPGPFRHINAPFGSVLYLLPALPMVFFVLYIA
jgi:hypothetical protein